jgi:23S rRNA (cytidine1920-2'-O)/16S rRNA (cytidine1409-2'-O)-methyltransferase
VKKERLDVLMVNRGLSESRSLAQRQIMAGQVRVADQVILKPAVMIDIKAPITIDKGPAFVSRGGEKLEAALTQFQIAIHDRVCADVGASTGGFTDCLLQHGARRVYAIDVGHGILHWKLRQDRRVVVMEDTNARYVTSLPEPIQVITIDASFISLRTLLPVAKGWLDPPSPRQNELDAAGGGAVANKPNDIITLIKPQFEAGRSQVARGAGVIRDPEIHRQVLTEILEFASSLGLSVHGLIRSPLLGPKGNTEFLAWFRDQPSSDLDVHTLIEKALNSISQPEIGKLNKL